LREYRSQQVDPPDFDAFWADTLAEAQTAAAASEPLLAKVDSGLSAIDVFDLTFAGFNGQPIKGWLRVPAGSTEPLPTVVEFVGYGGGRGRPWENLFWSAAGFAHVQMDTRGQGSAWSAGDTSDAFDATGPQFPGVMTRGIRDRSTYYYRRLMTDAVRAVGAARQLPQVDGSRLGVYGRSQGGALALAAAALAAGVSAVAAAVPFLADFPRASVITDANPFKEIGSYLAIHRDEVDLVHRTLSYFDSVNFARRGRVPALFTVALMDEITPPSTVFAAHNAYAGEKELVVWPYNGHEAGGPDDDDRIRAFFAKQLTA
jgi:cephalosporin-C deacetylase